MPGSAAQKLPSVHFLANFLTFDWRNIMTKSTKIAFVISALLAGAAFTTTASALTVVDQHLTRSAMESSLMKVSDQLARRGADDKGADDRGGRGRRGGEGAGHPAIEVTDQLARRGADDKGADDRGGRGRGGRG
jgi:hypothetical protein